MRTRIFAVAAALLTLVWSSANHAASHSEGRWHGRSSAGCAASQAPAAQVVVKRAAYTPSSAAR